MFLSKTLLCLAGARGGTSVSRQALSSWSRLARVSTVESHFSRLENCLRRSICWNAAVSNAQPRSASKFITVRWVNLGRNFREGDGRRYTESERQWNKGVAIYAVSFIILIVGCSFLAVPLYRAFCQATGYGGTTKRGHDIATVETMKPVEERELTIEFVADKTMGMGWNFKPLQNAIQVVPGETALAFYRARNPTDKPIIGISTYNVIPFEAGLYFNKIQCFCFEEQRLEPGEEVDMPVFFYIDPEIMENPHLVGVDTITLSYTFFEAREEQVSKFLAIMQSERDEMLEKAKQAAAKA